LLSDLRACGGESSLFTGVLKALIAHNLNLHTLQLNNHCEERRMDRFSRIKADIKLIRPDQISQA